MVFLFDSLEKVRGSISNVTSVLRSVEMLFSHHGRLLRIPNVHMVYAVPPWLKFVGQTAGPIVMLPPVRLEDRDGQDFEPGYRAMRSLMIRRFDGVVNCRRVFGPEDSQGRFPLAEILIRDSGGDFRTFLNLIREVVLRAGFDSIPVSPAIVEEARTTVRNEFLPIAIEDAFRLERIGRTKEDVLETGDDKEVEWLTRLLDTHRVLFLKNGGEWYDVHPLIRDEVHKIASRNRAHGE